MLGLWFLDGFERRRALLVALGGLVLGTAAGGLASGFASLLVARVIAGAFGGPATSLALAIVADAGRASRAGARHRHGRFRHRVSVGRARGARGLLPRFDGHLVRLLFAAVLLTGFVPEVPVVPILVMFAAFMVAAMLTELPGGKLEGMHDVALVSLGLAAILPLLVWRVEAHVKASEIGRATNAAPPLEGDDAPVTSVRTVDGPA